MAVFPYPKRSKAALDSVIYLEVTQQLLTTTGSYTHDVNVPMGMYLSAMPLKVAATNAGVKVMIRPYVDYEHTLAGSPLAIRTSAATAATSFTQAATSTTAGRVLYPYNGYTTIVIPTPVTSAFGFQVTVSSTALGATGSYTLGFVAMAGV